VWTPPKNPNPSTILHSAARDTREGHYEHALTKFLWFHNNAVQHDRALSAVRLSFAIGYWLDLATVYPPARDSFVRARDETEEAFRKNPSDFDLFHDVASMNDLLGDGIRTADLFGFVAGEDQAKAQHLYHVAEPHLIGAGRYRTCAPFLDPKRRMEIAERCYRVSKRIEDSRPTRGFPVPKLARTHYIRNVATLVGLLVLNDRVDDARKAYNASLAVINDDDFRTIMDVAMSGHLPDIIPR
jgi:hypothetical protein